MCHCKIFQPLTTLKFLFIAVAREAAQQLYQKSNLGPFDQESISFTPTCPFHCTHHTEHTIVFGYICGSHLKHHPHGAVWQRVTGESARSHFGCGGGGGDYAITTQYSPHNHKYTPVFMSYTLQFCILFDRNKFIISPLCFVSSILQVIRCFC